MWYYFLMKALLITLTVLLTLACGSTGAVKDAPQVIAPAYQETVYNGQVQPVEVSQDGDGAPLELRYFTSARNLELDEGGSPDAPAAAGVYFVRIRRPGGNGFAAGEDIVVEYHIEKAPVKIFAEPLQEAVYNGSPKSVTARSEPSFGLSAVYYPTREAREAARSDTASAAIRGFTRVERAPIEPGTYYVSVYYPGDDNYQYARLEIELIIHPAPRRQAQ
jgi:hypothetical protein